MIYPEQFKNSVLAAYPLPAPGQFGQTPSPARIRLAVETGDESLGRLLHESCCEKLEPIKIVTAFESGQPQTILAKAQQIMQRRELACQWLTLYGQESPAREKFI